MDDAGLNNKTFTEKVRALHSTTIEQYLPTRVKIQINCHIENNSIKAKPSRLFGSMFKKFFFCYFSKTIIMFVFIHDLKIFMMRLANFSSSTDKLFILGNLKKA